MARPPQTRPTKAEIASYYRTLKSAAKGGDVLACAELIKISIMDTRPDEPVTDLAASGERLLQAHEDLAGVVAELRKALADE